MTIRNVVIYPDEILRKPNATVNVFDEELKQLCADMFDTMYKNEGIGLAAPQIGINKKIVVIDIPDEDDIQGKKQMIFINPKITKPSNVTFTTLAVSEGRLVPNTVGQTAYYRSWEYEGRFFFEFFCDKSKTEKAINNHYVIIDPFCQRSVNSKPIDTAKRMTNMEYGEIDSNYTVISKSIILFE